jgi:hypothetical protein
MLSRVSHIPRLPEENLETVLDHAQAIEIGDHDADFQDLPERLGSDQKVIDLVRVHDQLLATERYLGLIW